MPNWFLREDIEDHWCGTVQERVGPWRCGGLVVGTVFYARRELPVLPDSHGRQRSRQRRCSGGVWGESGLYLERRERWPVVRRMAVKPPAMASRPTPVKAQITVTEMFWTVMPMVKAGLWSVNMADFLKRERGLLSPSMRRGKM